MNVRGPLPKLKRKYEVDESYWLVKRGRSLLLRAFFNLRRAGLTLKWGRIPKVWEMAFLDRMKEVERAELTFNEVLLSTLPQIFGEDTSEVLRTWIGRKARRNPEQFARSVSKMFGASARNVLGSIASLTDEESLLAKKAPAELPYQSLIDAIRKSEENMTSGLPSNRWDRR